MWLLILKDIDKAEVMDYLCMGVEYKQVGNDVHCQYYSKSDLLKDLRDAIRESDWVSDYEIHNLGKHNGLWFY